MSSPSSSSSSSTTRLVTEKPSVILLDIEGTMTDVGFVSRKLFPFIKAHVATYFEEAFENVETQELIKRMRENSRNLSEEESSALPKIEPATADRRAIIKSLAEYSVVSMRLKRRASEIKQLQILVWVWGYERGSLKGHVYDEVTTAMHYWKTRDRIALYVVSTGMIAAQQLLLCCTNHGNCLPMITDFFDNTYGVKTSPSTYQKIAEKVRKSVDRLLFITDSPKEATAALEAGAKAVIIKRPENKPRGLDAVRGTIPIITSFDDIKFK